MGWFRALRNFHVSTAAGAAYSAANFRAEGQFQIRL